MRNLGFIILLIASIWKTSAQCDENFTPNGFVDFLDTNGYSHTLNQYLMAGKIVVVDFYLLTCGSCMASAPCIEQIYQEYGQNTGDVIVLAFDVGDGNSTDDIAIEWAQENGMPNVPNFSQIGGEQDTGAFWGEFYFSCGENGGFAQTYIITGNFCCGDPQALNYETGCSAYCGNNSCCIYEANESIPIQGVSYIHQGGTVNCTEITNHIDNLLIDIVSLDEAVEKTPKTIINTINIFGQKVKNESNDIVFRIYNDGSVEKKYFLK